jgi:hypothetical protein
MLSSSLTKYSRKSFVINNSSLSIPELINDFRRTEEELRQNSAIQKRSRHSKQHSSENDLLDENTTASESNFFAKLIGGRGRIDAGGGVGVNDESQLTNFANLMLVASNQQYMDDEYDEEHVLTRNTSENFLFYTEGETYETNGDAYTNANVTNNTMDCSGYHRRTRLSENAAGAAGTDDSINFCNDVDFNNTDSTDSHGLPRLKLSENYSSIINLAKINESDDHNEAGGGACVGEGMVRPMSQPLQQHNQSSDPRFVITYQHISDERSSLTKNLRKNKNSFKIIQSARSSTSSILSIDRFKRMKSKRRSSSSQTSERANNRKIIYAKNLLEQIQNLHTQSSRVGMYIFEARQILSNHIVQKTGSSSCY